jgi:hypothetical protein
LKKFPQEPDTQRRATSSKDDKVQCFKCGEHGHEYSSCQNEATAKGKEAYQDDQDRRLDTETTELEKLRK